jgi:hypothetical protein
MPARKKTPRKVARPAKAVQAKLKQSQQEAKKFETELEEVFEQSREDGQKETSSFEARSFAARTSG